MPVPEDEPRGGVLPEEELAEDELAGDEVLGDALPEGVPDVGAPPEPPDAEPPGAEPLDGEAPAGVLPGGSVGAVVGSGTVVSVVSVASGAGVGAGPGRSEAAAWRGRGGAGVLGAAAPSWAGAFTGLAGVSQRRKAPQESQKDWPRCRAGVPHSGHGGLGDLEEEGEGELGIGSVSGCSGIRFLQGRAGRSPRP
ncbi:hypothetical protein [Streptomyces sp. KN37]|uniref:hypothetical protein n=1 Tax=Streptomyces sp. KN37 TaxID=3090667 RepID=UPI002A74CFD6|nr:hypothetical protein [Streptomyces sp. KN37]WPO70771.1 hypothetical protein R9806_09090 [Streptomyces sp. KN37]